MEQPEPDDQPDPLTRRLWTPWRMRYVGGGASEAGCLFCNRLRGDDDVQSLILHRAEHAFAIMNLFPYNTGHIMLVPNQHVASPEDAPREALREVADLLPPALRSLRRVLACQGFNVGLNVGSVAGAGVAEHMHQHVVPRWTGDANFMPILGGATVMPELIPVTYAKIRAELQRELAPGSQPCRLVVLDEPQTQLLLEPDGSLPVVESLPDRPIWRAAVDALSVRGVRAQIAGWAGSARADEGATLALALIAEPTSVTGTTFGEFVETTQARARLLPADVRTVEQATHLRE